MDTRKTSEVQSDSDGQYTSAPPNRLVGELSGMPHTTSLYRETSVSSMVKLVVCAVKETYKSRFNDFKFIRFLMSLPDLLRVAGA